MDRGIFVTSDEQIQEYGKIRNAIEIEPTAHGKGLLITALFDALMVEKIKTYSLNYEAPALLSDEIHDAYLKEYVYYEDDEEF